MDVTWVKPTEDAAYQCMKRLVRMITRQKFANTKFFWENVCKKRFLCTQACIG